MDFGVHAGEQSVAADLGDKTGLGQFRELQGTLPHETKHMGPEKA